jgi:RimJ/RimL family protein N-acetyltransferase
LSEIPPEDSFFDFKCPYCGEVNSFPVTSAQTLQECASCMESIIVPAVGAQTGGKLPLPMSTSRLVLRRFHLDDSVKLLEMIAQDESSILRIDETNVDQWIEGQRAARFTRGDSGNYLAVELAEGPELAGYVMFSYAERDPSTIGFTLTIVPSRRRQGLGLEAARVVMDFVFNGLCARRLALSCPSANAAGRGLLEKMGLRQEGECVKSWFDGKDWVNLSMYALLKEERAPRAPESA